MSDCKCSVYKKDIKSKQIYGTSVKICNKCWFYNAKILKK